jgi:hypothetical protein
MCYIDGQNNKYSVLNKFNRMLKYNIQYIIVALFVSQKGLYRGFSHDEQQSNRVMYIYINVLNNMKNNRAMQWTSLSEW